MAGSSSSQTPPGYSDGFTVAIGIWFVLCALLLVLIARPQQLFKDGTASVTIETPPPVTASTPPDEQRTTVVEFHTHGAAATVSTAAAAKAAASEAESAAGDTDSTDKPSGGTPTSKGGTAAADTERPATGDPGSGASGTATGDQGSGKSGTGAGDGTEGASSAAGSDAADTAVSGADVSATYGGDGDSQLLAVVFALVVGVGLLASPRFRASPAPLEAPSLTAVAREALAAAASAQALVRADEIASRRSSVEFELLEIERSLHAVVAAWSVDRAREADARGLRKRGKAYAAVIAALGPRPTAQELRAAVDEGVAVTRDLAAVVAGVPLTAVDADPDAG